MLQHIVSTQEPKFGWVREEGPLEAVHQVGMARGHADEIRGRIPSTPDKGQNIDLVGEGGVLNCFLP